MAKKRIKIDKKWFIDRLKDRKISMRGLGRHLRLDIWSVSKMLDGDRRMQTVEAEEIASIFGVPLAEVLEHAGIDVQGRSIDVVGYLDAGGVAHLVSKPTEQVLAPTDLDASARAITCRVATGPLAAFNGATLFVTDPIHDIDATVLNRQSLAKPVNQAPRLCYLKRVAGTVQLFDPLLRSKRGKPVVLEWAAPLLWIRF